MLVVWVSVVANRARLSEYVANDHARSGTYQVIAQELEDGDEM